jgi:hypothetical protein
LPPPPDASAGALEDDLRSLDEKIQSGTATPADVERFRSLVKKLQDEERKKPKKEFAKPRFKLNGHGQYQQGLGMSVMSAAAEQTTACAEFKNIYYDCASLPWDAADGWTRESEAGQVSVRQCAPDDYCASEGVLVIESREEPLFYRTEEGLVTERSASVGFRMRQTIGERNPDPGGWLLGVGLVWLDDGAKSTAVAFGEDYFGQKLVLMPTEGTFDPATGELNVTEVITAYHDWSAWHEYRLAKDSQGAIEFFVDDDPTPVLSYSYDALNMGTLGGPVVMFGHLIDGENSKLTSEYDFINYSVGMLSTDGCTSADGDMQLLSLINMTKVFDPTYENNDVIGRFKIATVEGLASNTQGHKFYLRTTREIRNADGDLVRLVTDNAQIGPVGTGKNPPDIMADGLSTWDGADSLGVRSPDGVYTYTASFSLVRADTKGKEKTLSTFQAGGGPIQLASPPFPVKPRIFKNRNVTRFYFSADWVDRREIGKVRKYAVGLCSLGADPILDVMFDLGSVAGVYPKIATNDNKNWCTCRYPYGDCGWECTTGSYVTITPARDGWVLILIRAKAANKGGTCTLQRLAPGGEWEDWDTDFTFGGDRVDWGWLRGDEIQNVNMSEGQDTFVIQAKPATFDIALEPDGRPSWDDDSGIAYASRAAMGFTQIAGSTFIGQKPWGEPGINHLYRNDVNHDSDGDGLGDALEHELGTCASEYDHFKNGAPCRSADGLKKYHLDGDDDGLKDDWEVFGCVKCFLLDRSSGVTKRVKEKPYPVDRNRAMDLELPRWGADPLKKDLFVEIDWMETDPVSHSHRPAAGAIQSIASLFAGKLVRYPDGHSAGTNLHYSTGQSGDLIGGGGPIPETEYFGSQDLEDDLRSQTPAVASTAPNRVGVFKYGVWGHRSAEDGIELGWGLCDRRCAPDLSATNGIPAPDCVFITWFNNQMTDPNYFDLQKLVGLHELGHTLYLSHGGPDRFWSPNNDVWTNFKPNYKSIMNYLYDRSIFDFSSGQNPVVYNEFHVDENNVPDIPGENDFDLDGIPYESDVRADLNQTCTSYREFTGGTPPFVTHHFGTCGTRTSCELMPDACLDYLGGNGQYSFSDCFGSAPCASGQECIELKICGDEISWNCEYDSDCSGTSCQIRTACVTPVLFRDYDDWNNLVLGNYNLADMYGYDGCVSVWEAASP